MLLFRQFLIGVFFVLATSVAGAQEKEPQEKGPMCQTGPVHYTSAKWEDCAIFPNTGESNAPYIIEAPVFFHPHYGKLVFQDARSVCGRCIAVWRQYVFAFGTAIRNPLTEKINIELNNKSVLSIRGAFPESALKALSAYTDTTSIGWTDKIDAICRAHRKKPSIVLQAPYYEDVEYCINLVMEDGIKFEDVGFQRSVPFAPHLFRIQTEVTVAVTKNPGSPYREPTNEEIAPYGDVLVQLGEKTKATVAEKLQDEGWTLSKEEEFPTVLLTGFKSKF